MEMAVEHEHSDPVGESPYHRRARSGYVYQCRARGKKSVDNYGNEALSYGFDESCALNCVLVKATPPDSAKGSL